MQEQEKTDNKETTNDKEETYIKFNGTNYIFISNSNCFIFKITNPKYNCSNY